MVREALEELETGTRPTSGAQLYGRLVLCAIHAERGQYDQALRELDSLEFGQRAFGAIVPGVFLGIVSCLRAWVVARSGRAAEAVELLREGRGRMTSVQGSATVFADHMAVMLLLPVAGVLLEFARQCDDRSAAHRAAVLMGAQRALYGAMGSYLERQDRERVAAQLREFLGADAYRQALEEGGRLTVGEAAAMLNAPGDF
jgi:hypothetical protein